VEYFLLVDFIMDGVDVGSCLPTLGWDAVGMLLSFIDPLGY
jgi:hypothetical protein